MTSVMVLIDLLIGQSSRHSAISFFLATIFLGILSILLFAAGEMGMDYHGYRVFYDIMPTFRQYWNGASLLPLNLEPGFQIIVMTAKSLGLGVRGPVLLLYFLSCFILLKGCKLAKLPPLTVSALFTLLIYPEFYGQQRMAFVYTCGILILGYLNSGKLSFIFMTTTLATMFQYVALAYLAALVVHFVDKERLPYVDTISSRFVIVFGGVRKTFSRDRILYIFPLTLVTALILAMSAANKTVIVMVLGLLESDFWQLSPVVQKFMSYYHRSQEIALSFWGFSGTALFILISLITYSAHPIYDRLRYGIYFLIISLFSFVILSPLPFVSYRVVLMFYLSGLIYVGSLIISRKVGLYIGPAALVVLILVRYINMVSSLGPYSF